MSSENPERKADVAETKSQLDLALAHSLIDEAVSPRAP